MKNDLGYVVQEARDGGLVKIGRSSTPQRRVRAIEHGVPFRVRTICYFAEGARTEEHLHQLLKDQQVKGEWFSPSPALIDELTAMESQGRTVQPVERSQDYFERVMLNRLLGYIESKPKRSINQNAPGDLLYRILHGEPLSFIGREDELAKAVPNVFTTAELFGWTAAPVLEAIRLGPPLSVIGAASAPEAAA